MAPRSHYSASGLALALLLVACADPAPPSSPSSPSPPAAPGSGGRARTGGAACKNPGAGPEPDARGVRSLVRRNLDGIRGCYDRALKRNPELSGKAVLRFSIGTCGEVLEVEVAARGGEVAEARDCVARLARGWRTPFRPAEPVAIEYPLAFSAQ